MVEIIVPFSESTTWVSKLCPNDTKFWYFLLSKGAVLNLVQVYYYLSSYLLIENSRSLSIERHSYRENVCMGFFYEANVNRQLVCL